MPEGSRRSPPHGVPRRFRAAEWSRRGPPADQIQVRADGTRVRSLEVLCQGGRREVILNVDQDPGDLLVREFGPRLVCTQCGMVGADVRPNWKERKR
jgi:hypothetical protein